MTSNYEVQKAKEIIRRAVVLLQRALSQNDWAMVSVYARIIAQASTVMSGHSNRWNRT